MIKQHNTEGKPKLQDELIITESKTYYWINISSLHKHPVIEYKVKIFDWKNNNWMTLLYESNIKMKSLNENRNAEYN